MNISGIELTGLDITNNFISSTGITTSSLFIHLDASNPSSYSGTGSTWVDISGNGIDANISGATFSATDGGLFDFDGSTSTISLGNNSNLSLSTSAQRTIQVWVKFDTLPALNTNMPVFGKLSSGFGFDGYWSGLYSNSGLLRSVTNGTSVQRVLDSTSSISTNTWYFYTFISQISSTSNTTKVYINTTEYITGAHGSDSYNETNPLYLGYIGAGVGSTYLDGKIGACYFYTKGLSLTEITDNFNATKTRFGL